MSAASQAVRQDFGGWFLFAVGLHVLMILSLVWLFAKKTLETPISILSSDSPSSSNPEEIDLSETNWIEPIEQLPESTADDPESDIVLAKAETRPLPNLTPVPDPPEAAPRPTPKLEPVPKPEPPRQPKLEPAPTPKPTPKLEPAPAPRPKLEPAPAPRPEPKPQPRLAPAPAPKPQPRLDPAPAPAPKPQPRLDPAPAPNPQPRLAPAPNPAPRPTPSPGPVIRPTPLPIPAPPNGTNNGNGSAAGGTGNRNPQPNPAPPASRFGDIGAYKSHIGQVFYANWSQPRTIQTGGQKLRTVVQLKISRSGQILDARITQSSGHPEMDESVRQALLKVRKVDPIPEFYQNNTFSVPLNFDI